MEGNAVYEKPPEALKQIFKRYQKISLKDLEDDENVLDLSKLQREEELPDTLTSTRIDGSRISRAFSNFSNFSNSSVAVESKCHEADTPFRAFQPKEMPDLVIVPNMLPVHVLSEVLTKIFHRDLQNPEHKTNVHMHHNISYPGGRQSFFSLDPFDQDSIYPKDPNVHKPMSVQQFLNKKLRWITLGGQYDWTEKVYPDERPPAFPADLTQLIQGLFPETTPEAAIVNLYSPGDTLSLHKDVSEECGKGLVSISVGCDALFVIGQEEESNDGSASLSWLVLRLRSGDALYMSGGSRFAWHGVPKIIPDTCPQSLQSWPHNPENTEPSFSEWRGWLASRRVNLNVRQMRE